MQILFIYNITHILLKNQQQSTESHMLAAGVLLEAHLSSPNKLVAQVLESPTPASLALLIRLLLADFGVAQPAADILVLLLAVLLLLLVLIAALLGDAPLAPPIAPHMCEVISSQEGLIIFPIQGIPAKDVVRELRQDGCSLRIASDVLL